MQPAQEQSEPFKQESKESGIECVWMSAGLIRYKLCDYAFDCENCPFDKAFRNPASASRRAATAPASDHRGSAQQGSSAEEPVRGYKLAEMLFYHPCHCWVRVEDQGRIRTGVDDFAQKLVGPISSVALPEIGSRIGTGSSIWSISHQFGKTTLTTPIQGTVQLINRYLFDRPTLVNRDPYGEGWAMIIQPENLEQSLKALAYGETARTWFERDVDRLNEAYRLVWGDRPDIGVTMQDGGGRFHDFTQLFAGDQVTRLIDSFLSDPASRRFEYSDSAMRTKGR
jgi:glycine cleavage system H lipoate-binding protein